MDKLNLLSKTPTAVCGNHAMGLPTCEKGLGRNCYYKGVCSQQCQADGKTPTLAAQRKLKEEEEAALRHAREISSHDPMINSPHFDDFMQRMVDDAREYERTRPDRPESPRAHIRAEAKANRARPERGNPVRRLADGTVWNNQRGMLDESDREGED